jgi:hypothetical protein
LEIGKKEIITTTNFSDYMAPQFKNLDSGNLDGCTKMNWGSQWYFAILVIIGVYSLLIPLAVKLSLLGMLYLSNTITLRVINKLC